MSDQSTPSNPPRVAMDSFEVIIQKIWRRYNQQFPLFLVISVVASVVQIVYSFVPTAAIQNWTHGQLPTLSPLFWTLTIAALVIGLVLSAWAGLALLFVIAQPTTTKKWQEAFRLGGRFFWPSLTTGIILAVILGVSTLFLIIPGIYVGVIFGFSSYLVFKEKLRNWSALQRSRELVRGYWWPVFWRELGVNVVYAFGVGILTSTIYSIAAHFGARGELIIGGILSSLLIVLTLPFATLGQAVICDNLLALKSAGPEAKKAAPAA